MKKPNTKEKYSLEKKLFEITRRTIFSETKNGPKRYFSYLRCRSCESDVTIYSRSWQQVYPTIPTIIELEISEILDNKKFTYNYALGNNKKMDTIERLNDYKYIFLKNEITNTKKYKLFITDENDERVELKKGEVFRRAIGSYSTIGLSIASKNCQENNIFDMFSGDSLEINDDGEIVIKSFTDDDIPSHCKVSDGLKPGIIAAIVIAIVVVIAAIIAVVIIVIKKRKSNHSSQEGNTEKNAENA